MCTIPWPAGHTCGECGIPAVVAYGWTGSEDKYACDAHDPMRPPFGAVMNMPWEFRYVRMAPTMGAAPAPGTWSWPVNQPVTGGVAGTVQLSDCTASAP